MKTASRAQLATRLTIGAAAQLVKAAHPSAGTCPAFMWSGTVGMVKRVALMTINGDTSVARW